MTSNQREASNKEEGVNRQLERSQVTQDLPVVSHLDARCSLLTRMTVAYTGINTVRTRKLEALMCFRAEKNQACCLGFWLD